MASVQAPPQPPQATGGKLETILVLILAESLGAAAVKKPSGGLSKIDQLTRSAVGVAALSFGLLLLDQFVPDIANGMAWLVLITLLLYNKGQPLIWIANNFFGTKIKG